jgi:hypothetical protein
VAGDDFSTRTAVLACIEAAKTTTNKSADVGAANMTERYMD